MNVWLAGLILGISAGILLIAFLPRRRRHGPADEPLSLISVSSADDVHVAQPAPGVATAPAPAASSALAADAEAALVRARLAGEHMAALEADIVRLHEQFEQRLDSIEAALQIRLDMLEQGFKADLMAKVEEQRAELERVSDHFQWLRMIASGLHKQEARAEPLAIANGFAQP